MFSVCPKSVSQIRMNQWLTLYFQRSVWGHVTSRKECHDVTRRVFDMNVDDIRRKDCVNYDMDEKGAKMIRKVYIVSTPLR